MKQTSDLAIVLKSVRYQDRHKIVTALTQNNGLISCIAQNSIQSRRFGGCLEAFSVGLWQFSQKNSNSNLFYLQEASPKKSFNALEQSFTALSLASFFNELLLRVIAPGESCPQVFQLHFNALCSIDHHYKETHFEWILINGFLTKLLQWYGYQPQLHACISCNIPTEKIPQNSQLLGLAPKGGWLCEDCSPFENKSSLGESIGYLTKNALSNFNVNLNFPIKKVSQNICGTKKDHQALYEYLFDFAQYHLPGLDQSPLKSARFLVQEPTLQPQVSHHQ